MNRVIHFELQADNIDRAKKFYEKVLGWKITKMMSKDQGGMDYWGVDTGEGPGISGGMYERPEDDPFFMYHCTVAVTDMDSAVKAIKENGGQIIREKTEIPTVGWFATAKDTEGNMFSLLQPTMWKPK